MIRVDWLERWRWILGYEGLYRCSDWGRVWAVDRVVSRGRNSTKKLKGRILTPAPRKQSGHLVVTLCKEGVERKKYIHRLVMAAWVGPCPDNCEVLHGPAGVADNSISNLSYGTRKQNQLDRRRDGTANGRRVRRSDGVEFINMQVAAEESGCAACNIWACCKGYRKTTGGHGWEYIND